MNDSDFEQGNTIFYRIFLAELHKYDGLNVVHEGDIRKILRQMRIPPNQMPQLDQLLVVADRLSVDALILGRIVKMEEKKGAAVTDPIVAIDLKMIDAKNGNTMFSVYHSRRGEDYRKLMHFGLINTVTELSAKLSSEILEVWFTQGFSECR